MPVTKRHAPEATPTRRDRAKAARDRRAASSVSQPDPRALLAYLEWLHMEHRLLAVQLFPELGSDAERFIPSTRSAFRFHLPIKGDWRDVPPPSSRAEAILTAVGVDWQNDRAPPMQVR